MFPFRRNVLAFAALLALSSPVLAGKLAIVIDDFGYRPHNENQVLGMAFEPEEYYENPDGTPINFNTDYFGDHRGEAVIPGPFACKCGAEKELF